MTDDLLLFLFACSVISTALLYLALLEAWAERRAQKRRDRCLFLGRLYEGETHE